MRRLFEKQSVEIKMTQGGKRPDAGRKPGTPNKATAEIRALAQKYTPDAMKELARLAREAVSESARGAAIKEIFDRGYGRAVQSLTGGEDGAPLIIKIVQFAAPEDV